MCDVGMVEAGRSAHRMGGMPANAECKRRRDKGRREGRNKKKERDAMHEMREEKAYDYIQNGDNE